jgi:hypothetical protein
LNKIAYVNYTNYQNNNLGFILNNPSVETICSCPGCPDTSCVGNVAPVISIISPLNKIYNNSLVGIDINVTDSNLVSVWYNLNGINNTYSVPFNINLSDRDYRLYVYSNDSCGNLSSTFVDFVVNTSLNDNPIDSIGPNVTILSPVERVYNTKVILLNITAVDDIAVDSIWYFLNGVRYEYNTSYYMNLEEGHYTLLAYANDSLGNEGSTGVSFIVNLTDDGDDHGDDCVDCGGHTRAPVNDFDSSEISESIFMDEAVIILENNSTFENGFKSEGYLSEDVNRLIFNMILLIAIIILLLLIVLIGRKNN